MKKNMRSKADETEILKETEQLLDLIKCRQNP